MIIAYIKWKNISQQSRTIILSVAGGVFLIIFILSVWQQYFANHLVRYIPDEAIFYTYFSLPTINHFAELDEMVSVAVANVLRINNDKTIDDFPINSVNRELAIVGWLQDEKINYGILVRGDYGDKLKEFIVTNGLSFRHLAGRDLLIVVNDQIADDFLELKTIGTFRQKIKHKFHWFNTIAIYTDSQIFEHYPDDLLMQLMNGFLTDNNELWLRVQAKRWGLKAFNYAGSVFSVHRSATQPDLTLQLENLQHQIDGWTNRLDNMSASRYIAWQNFVTNWQLDDNNGLFDRKITFFLNQKPELSGWFLVDYDFCLLFHDVDLVSDSLSQETIEKIIKVLLAKQYPSPTVKYLSDGVKVIELKAKTDKFKFTENAQRQEISSPDGLVKVFYFTDNNTLIVGNSESLCSNNFDKKLSKSVSISTDLLPNSFIWQYLKYFDHIKVE